MEKELVLSTHQKPDLDAITSIVFFLEANEIQEISEIPMIFTDTGDEDQRKIPMISNVSNMIQFDRGRGVFDHHGTEIATTAEIVAERYGLRINEHIFRFLKLVENNDARGISEPFDTGDMIKRIAHSGKIADEDILKIGIRIIKDALDFKQLEIAEEIQRDHEFTRSVIKQFIYSRKFRGPKLQKYYELLGNPNFERQFDFCEVLTMEKKKNGPKEARKFGLKVLALITKQERNFDKALRELEDPKITRIYHVPGRSYIIVTVISENPEINRAARYKWPNVAVIIQKNEKISGIQVYPNKKIINKDSMDNITAAVRLEEQILSGSPRITTNLNTLTAERIQWIPQWYYTRERGYFLFNRSLTATDTEIPETKISLQRIAEIAQLVLSYKNFNFAKYAAERIAKNLKKS